MNEEGRRENSIVDYVVAAACIVLIVFIVVAVVQPMTGAMGWCLVPLVLLLGAGLGLFLWMARTRV